MKDVVLKPRMSEKTYAQSADGVYTFVVPRGSSKAMIAKAVEAQFGVTVTAVNVANVKGKPKQSYRKGARPVAGQRSTIRKAYVTLKSGDSIPVFAGIDQSSDVDEKIAKAEAADKAKAAAKTEPKRGLRGRIGGNKAVRTTQNRGGDK